MLPTLLHTKKGRLLAAGALLATLLGAATLTPRTAPPAAEPPVMQPLPPPPPQEQIRNGTLQRGDTLSTLLEPHLDESQRVAACRAAEKVYSLRRMSAGHAWRLCLLGERPQWFEYDIGPGERLRIELDPISAERVVIPTTTELVTVSGTIDSSLYAAIGEAGEGWELAGKLAEIFAWEIDFHRDIRPGDSFAAVVEKQTREGVFVGYGAVLAAMVKADGEPHEAYRFAPKGGKAGYFNRDGGALRKAFLRAPLSFSRVTSGYSLKRFHPIAKTWKAHPAIDYGAPTGTPIMAVGTGKIVEIGRSAGNGNYIKLSHQSGYTSLYLHMSKFAKNLKRGSRVEQGQVIGYVGATGLATGPHLCFRMTRNGAPVNPAKLKSVAAPGLGKESLAAFATKRDPLRTRLREAEARLKEQRKTVTAQR